MAANFLKKLRGIMPLPGEDRNSNNELNKFTYKLVYLKTAEISFYSTPDQNPPSGTQTKARMVHFLNAYDITALESPCNNLYSVCTVQEYITQVIKPNGMADFKAIPAVEEGMGSKYNTNCLMIIDDILTPYNNLTYLCSEDLKILDVRKKISKASNAQVTSDVEERADWLIESEDKLLKVTYELTKQNFKVSDGTKELFKYKLSDLIGKAIQLNDKTGSIPWKGKKELKPEDKRCWYMEVKETNAVKAMDKKTKKIYFCTYDKETAGKDGSTVIKLNPEEGAAATCNAVQKLNELLQKNNLDITDNQLPTATGITKDSSILDPIKENLIGEIMELNSDLQSLQGEGSISPDDAAAAKIKGIAESIKENCKGNAECVIALEGAIKDGDVPLETDGAANANSTKNPYGAKEDKSKAGKLPKDGKGGDSVEVPPPASDGPKCPSPKDLQDALAAIAQYLKGQKAENLFKLDKFCDPVIKQKGSDDTSVLPRSIAAIGLLGTVDPYLWWLERATKTLLID